MKRSMYTSAKTVMTFLLGLVCSLTFSQDCSNLEASFTTTESRCIATGTIQVTATGGSGNYNYKIEGPVTSAFTSSNMISGLSAGTYTLSVKDILSGCIIQRTNVVIAGSYSDPRFTLSKTDVTCLNGNDGSIATNDLQFGRGPFTFTIVTPSPSAVGVSNNTGNFSNLAAGDYVVQLRDSCGGLQTRRITVLNYDWWIDGYSLSKTDCDNAIVTVNLKDSKGNTNNSGLSFNFFSYGVVRTAGDTIWSAAKTSTFYLGNIRSVQILAKDGCGNIKKINWNETNIPSVAAAVVPSALACSTFTASVTGQQNLTNPQYCLYNSNNTLVVCNTSGIFSNISYGNYNVRITDLCYDTVINRSLTVNHTIPSVGASTSISNRLCSTYTATVTSKVNLTNEQYCLFNSSNVQVACNTNGVFSNIPYGTYTIRITDGCYDTTIVRTVSASASVPSLGTAVNITSRLCTTFTASITSPINLTNPQYTLYDAADNAIATNATGSFTNLAYGSYCIRMKNDLCNDTTISRCFNAVRAIPALNAGPSITAATCSTFTASIGGTNLTSPQYCLYDSNNNLVACNSTGTFSNLSYQNYCIRMVNDPCYDTTISRCFIPSQPVPAVAASAVIANRTCSTFRATITGTNLTTPVYTLRDNSNTTVATNSTGVFPDLPYGSYCVTVQNSTCYDTSFTRCFSSTPPIPSVAATVTADTRACSTFRAVVSGGTNLTNPVYNLYNSSNTLIASGTNGQFVNIPYGNYTIRIVNSCYDTTIVRTVSATRISPSVATAVNISNKACSTFSAATGSTSNLYNAQYSIYNSSNTLVSTNSSGAFNNLPYGNYCIRIADGCYDTTIVRCISVAPNPVQISLSAIETCIIGTTNLNVTFSSGNAPFTIKVYDPGGNLVRTVNTASNVASVNNLPGLPSPLQYKVVGSDLCNAADSQMITPKPGTLVRNRVSSTKCPSAEWSNGATNIEVSASSNMGIVTPAIIRKNGVNVSISYSSYQAGLYRFVDLEPATYIIAYTIQNCSGQVFDTIQVEGYTYPNLQRSAAYQCDNNSFSVGASLQGGATPFTYEVIGSMPASPSIITAAQNSPVFSINNGTEYSLVRLRAVDVCGNATLNDVSILPLANIVVSASSNCFYNDISLSVDTIPNAVYQWYKKTSSTDSTLVGSSSTHALPYLLPSDTGTYVCKTSVNGGCLTKVASFRVTGACGTILASRISLTGKTADKANKLNWHNTSAAEVKQYIVERSDSKNGNYVSIGSVHARPSVNGSMFEFSDNNPLGEYSYYRIKIVHANSKTEYSNVIVLRQNGSSTLSVFPNPVKDVLSVYISSNQKKSYRLSLYTSSGQMVSDKVYQNIQESTIRLPRDSKLKSGVYILRVTNTSTGELNAYRVVFE